MSDPLTLGMIGGTVIGGLGNLWNAFTGERSYQYQKDLNNLQMSREDTAWQRAVADVEKAGISKAALTGGANSQALSAGAAPTLKTDFQQRLLNNLSASQMKTQNDNLQTQLDLAKQQLEDYGKTRDSKVAAETAEYEWRKNNPGTSVAGYPSFSQAVVSQILEYLNKKGGFGQVASGVADVATPLVQEVKQAAENAVKTVKSEGHNATAKLNGSYRTEEQKKKDWEKYSKSESDGYSMAMQFQDNDHTRHLTEKRRY